MSMSAEEFWEKFGANLKAELLKTSDWENKYRNRKVWTKYITKFFEDLANKFDTHKNLEPSTEYYRIDIGYYSYDETNTNIFGIKEWDFEVAIEHENDKKTWFQEFNKLLHINCGLKVLVAYYDNSDLDKLNEKMDAVKESYGRRKYNQINNSQDLKDNWLFIFGPVRLNDAHDFIAFKFDGTEYERLINMDILK